MLYSPLPTAHCFMQRLARYAWFVLGVNVLVILWGAYVRASKSGDGCGSHWPLCNGLVVPNVSRFTTIVEFTHRLTSGVAFILVVILLVRAWRTFGKGHPARAGALASLIFISFAVFRLEKQFSRP